MKHVFLSLLLCLTLLLTACAVHPVETTPTEPPGTEETASLTQPTETQQQETTPKTEPETESATEPVSLEPDATALTEEEIARLETLLLDETEWYGLVLSGDFETPEEVPVELMFGNGSPGSSSIEPTESERSFLLEYWSEHSLMMDISRTSRTEYLYTLEKYLGLSQEAALSLDLGGLIYMAETDSYYSCQNSAMRVYPAIYAAYLRADGTISVYYKDAFEDYGLSAEYDSIAVLQPREDGYVVLSNDRHIYWND